MMKTVTQILKVIQTPSGKFVKTWQYSQGHFDVVETDDIFQALKFNDNQQDFNIFFSNLGYIQITVEVIFQCFKGWD